MLSVMLYPCILCVALLMDLFVLCVCELFGETIRNMIGCGCYFVVLSSKECACCASEPSVHLSVPSIGFVYV